MLCHELAHIFLGHLGSDEELGWPSRTGLTHDSVEIEAESVSHIVMVRMGLVSASDAYLSSYFKGEEIPAAVSVELITKVATKLENMSLRSVPRPTRKGKKAAGSVDDLGFQELVANLSAEPDS